MPAPQPAQSYSSPGGSIAQNIVESRSGKWNSRKGEGMCFCPAHKDENKPNLSVRDDNGFPLAWISTERNHPNRERLSQARKGLI
jgi:hypothetical protein